MKILLNLFIYGSLENEKFTNYSPGVSIYLINLCTLRVVSVESKHGAVVGDVVNG